MLIDPVAISPQGSLLVQAAKKHEDAFAGLPAYHEPDTDEPGNLTMSSGFQTPPVKP